LKNIVFTIASAKAERCKWQQLNQLGLLVTVLYCYIHVHIYIFAGPVSLNDVWVHLLRIISILNDTSKVLFLAQSCHYNDSIIITATVHLKYLYLTIKASLWKKRSKYVKMFEREKTITNLSLTFLSVANKFHIYCGVKISWVYLFGEIKRD